MLGHPLLLVVAMAILLKVKKIIEAFKLFRWLQTQWRSVYSLVFFHKSHFIVFLRQQWDRDRRIVVGDWVLTSDATLKFNFFWNATLSTNVIQNSSANRRYRYESKCDHPVANRAFVIGIQNLFVHQIRKIFSISFLEIPGEFEEKLIFMPI